MCRAYNRWLADYCKPYPDRLFGVAMLPMQSMDLAVEEMAFARKELGFKAGFLRPNPYNNMMLHHPDYDRFWSAMEDLDVAIGLHEGASGGMPQVGVDRFDKRGAKHIISHTMEMMLVALSVIWQGVCDRHPKVRIGFLESGGGWTRSGSTGWIATSRPGLNDSAQHAPESFGATAGSRSSRWRAASVLADTSARTRSSGPRTIASRGFSRAPEDERDRPQLSAGDEEAASRRWRARLLQTGKGSET